MSDSPTPSPSPEEPRRSDRGWRIFGTVLLVVFAILGIAAVVFAVLFFIALNSWGNNK